MQICDRHGGVDSGDGRSHFIQQAPFGLRRTNVIGCTTRTVLGALMAWLLRMFAFLLRLLGHVGFYAGRFIVNVYDLAIFPTIWLEGIILGSKDKKIGISDAELSEDSTLVEEAADSFEETLKIKEPQE